MRPASLTGRNVMLLHLQRIAAADRSGLKHTVTLPVPPSHCAGWMAANVLGRHVALHNPIAEVTTWCFARAREASAFKLVYY